MEYGLCVVEDLRRGERQVQSVNQVRLGSGGQAYAGRRRAVRSLRDSRSLTKDKWGRDSHTLEKDRIEGCIVPAPRRGGSIRNENYRAHAAKTSCDISHARRNGSLIEWMLQLGLSKRAQRRRLSWTGMLQCFERGYEVTPRRKGSQLSFAAGDWTHFAGRSKGYDAARVERELTLPRIRGRGTVALHSPGAVQSPRDSVTGMGCRKIDLIFTGSKLDKQGEVGRELGARVRGAVNAHATHLKWRDEGCDGIRGRAKFQQYLNWSKFTSNPRARVSEARGYINMLERRRRLLSWLDESRRSRNLRPVGRGNSKTKRKKYWNQGPGATGRLQ
ncbi:hypothetical protein DFH09DRAFT_1421741 [Mycena vulgaris]|nr:hypothetical protein DFH09DRAFT_1421741 [Mycena vulgaris]